MQIRVRRDYLILHKICIKNHVYFYIKKIQTFFLNDNRNKVIFGKDFLISKVIQYKSKKKRKKLSDESSYRKNTRGFEKKLINF